MPCFAPSSLLPLPHTFFFFLHDLLSVPCSCLNKPQIGWGNGAWACKRFAWIFVFSLKCLSMKVTDGINMKSFPYKRPLPTPHITNLFLHVKNLPKYHSEEWLASENVQHINCQRQIRVVCFIPMSLYCRSCISLPCQVLSSWTGAVQALWVCSQKTCLQKMLEWGVIKNKGEKSI